MSCILVIDDEQPIRSVLRSILERVGYMVLDAPNGRQALALLRDQPTDVVVTDIFMPEKDGIEVLREMKNAMTKPKIIVMSGGGLRGLFDLTPAALLLGADRILLKPFDQCTFLLAVEEVLNDHV